MIRSNNMPRRGFGLRSLVAAVAVVCSLAAGQSARAVDITFDLTQIAFNQPTASLTSGGYTLLFTGIGGNLTGSADQPNGGLLMGTTDFFSDRYFSITKTAGATDLIFKSYKMGAVNLDSGTGFNLSGGTGTSTGNTFTAYTTRNYNGSYSLVGAQSVTYSPVIFDAFVGDYVKFNTLTFTAVPEPSTYALGAIATGVMAAIARRRKARKD